MYFLSWLNLKAKIIFITYAMVALVVVAGAIAIERVIVPAIEADLFEKAAGVARSVVNQVRGLKGEDKESRLRAGLLPLFSAMPELFFIEVLDQDGSSSFWMGDERFREKSAKPGFGLEKQAENLFFKRPTSGDPLYEVLVRDPGKSPPKTALAVRIGVGAKSINHISSKLFRVLFTVTLLILSLSFLLTRSFTKMITRPVERLMRMTYSLARGELDEVLEEVERELPCRQTIEEDFPLVVSSDWPGSCPLFGSEKEKRPTPVKDAPYSSCKYCNALKCSTHDELSTLLLGFKLMAVRMGAYQKKLAGHYEFEARLLDACPDGIMANDLDGRIIMYNKGAERLLGYGPDEVLHKLPVSRVYPPGEAPAVKRALLSDSYGSPGTLIDYTTRILSKDGRTIPIRLSAALLSKGEEETAVVGYFHDLTELNRHMSALVEANERFSMLNRRYLDMLSFVTHELKSPIANSYMSANALRQEVFGTLAPEQSLMVEAVCCNLDQSMEMIRHYLDLSRIEKDELPVEPRPCRIMEDIIEPVVESLGCAVMERRSFICLDVSRNFEWSLDPELFRSVFSNLLTNALKYGDEPGRIRISVSDLEGRCRMEVWSSGPGIRREDLDLLFKKFQRLHTLRRPSTRGTGLGLFITKSIVERHQGTIRAESLEGEWAAFIIELPGISGK